MPLRLFVLDIWKKKKNQQNWKFLFSIYFWILRNILFSKIT